MLSGTLRRTIGPLAVGLIATASIGVHSAAAANVRHTRHADVSHAYANHAYASYRHGPWISAQGPTECDRRPRLNIRPGRRHSWRVLRPADERLHKRVPRRQVDREVSSLQSGRDAGLLSGNHRP
jgi:hypothetical protein